MSDVVTTGTDPTPNPHRLRRLLVALWVVCLLGYAGLYAVQPLLKRLEAARIAKAYAALDQYVAREYPAFEVAARTAPRSRSMIARSPEREYILRHKAQPGFMLYVWVAAPRDDRARTDATELGLTEANGLFTNDETVGQSRRFLSVADIRGIADAWVRQGPGPGSIMAAPSYDREFSLLTSGEATGLVQGDTIVGGVSMPALSIVQLERSSEASIAAGAAPWAISDYDTGVGSP